MAQEASVRSLQQELASVGSDLANGGDFLRGILAGCGDCIKILDLDGRLQFMSEGGKRVMEVDDFDKLKGCPWPGFWAGDGNTQAKAAVADAKAGRTARFRNAANTAKGNPRYWDVQVSPIFGEGGTVSHLLSISRDITEEWHAAERLKQDAERQRFLAEELSHRVKNTLATVLVMAGQTFHAAPHKEQLERFVSRIKTLDDAYVILTEASWSATSVRTVVESAVNPYRTITDRFAISGPDYKVLPNQALILALAINELATNAMKYGALSHRPGRIDISWDCSNGFRFEWREIDGPAVVPPTRSGFGSRLITKLLASEFKGTVDLRHEPSGVTCALNVPAK